MPRPKGSKNKKTIAKNVDIAAQLEEKKAAKADLENEQTTILSVIASNQARLKDVKKDLKALDRDILKLEAKQAEAEAAVLAAAKKDELQAAIDGLIAEGTSIDDILDRLRK